MDYTALTRDATKVHQDWVAQANGKITTRSGCKIYIPRRWTERKLATIGTDTYVLGMFPIVVGDKYYGVSSVCSQVKLANTNVSTVTIAGEQHYEFVYEPGDVVVDNVNMIVQNTLCYYIYDEFQAKGHVPWYFNFVDLANLFSTAIEYANFNPRTNLAILEMIAATMSRKPGDRKVYFRQSISSYEELVNQQPEYIALRNIQIQTSNTVSKFIGSYFREAVNSALVDPATRLEGIETILRA